MKIQTVSYKDDLGGAGEATTVVFEYEGRKYEIDLNRRNNKTFARRISALYAPYLAAARDVTPAASSPDDVRTWAHSVGMPVAARGRIPVDVQAAYDAALAIPGQVFL